MYTCSIHLNNIILTLIIEFGEHIIITQYVNSAFPSVAFRSLFLITNYTSFIKMHLKCYSVTLHLSLVQLLVEHIKNGILKIQWIVLMDVVINNSNIIIIIIVLLFLCITGWILIRLLRKYQFIILKCTGSVFDMNKY